MNVNQHSPTEAVTDKLSPLSVMPLVSIIIPSYNQGRYIRQAIDSCLRQSYRPIEVIVVDGGSTDETVEVLKSYPELAELRWISESDNGVQDAVNKGVGMAQGEICGIQSSDDGYQEGAIEKAVSEFRQHPQAALVYGDSVRVNENGEEIERWITGPFSIPNFLSKRTHVPQCAAFFRREAFVRVGGWSQTYFIADTECWLRMILRFPARKMDAFWGWQRRHEQQRDHQQDRIRQDFESMLLNNEQVINGPRRWQRAAKCGIIRHSMRYGESLNTRESRRRLLKAVWLWPPVILDPTVASLLIPFYLAIRSRLGARCSSRKNQTIRPGSLP